MVHIQNISAESSEVQEFRRVVWTGKSSQLVLMSVPPGGDIGEEVHHVDQHLFFTAGKAKAVVGGEEKVVEAGDLVIVPQGVKHNFVNAGPTPFTLYTVYAPAEHDPRSVHKTKEEGDKLEDEGKDEAPKWAK
ncbi:RmlC-like cupin domain-containing protein [Dioszegia hungarica]|uniref:RmlC-like cupin domain-containing protein n=1 Tax=Dioszegia hungarica TaxID=4972 RepID=A0AA38LPI7_9TREE|nr:RmlC-like cupin domain-containing protein [Dioszegia hungarica]KAI9632142.1 RmlC-like cupin domain-containing protein [Dioszegia hungarica]